MEARTARENWFKQIFPVEEFGKSFQEQMVSRLVSMSSKHFWAGLGDIQEMIFQNDKSRWVEKTSKLHFTRFTNTPSWLSQRIDFLTGIFIPRACALPIQTGAVSENQIRFNAYAVPILQKTIQFNQSSLTWSCLVSRQVNSMPASIKSSNWQDEVGRAVIQQTRMKKRPQKFVMTQ